MNIQSSASGRFALSHVAAAAALTLGMLGSNSWALGLGRLSVQSALGETLKAEIDVTSLSPEEAGTLKVRVAPPEAYRASGVEYNAVLMGTQVNVVRNNGRTVLRVSSDRAVQEPFVDVILELSWASGRLVREYTLLFDPPSNPKPVAAPPAIAAAPVIAPAAPETAPVQAPPPAVAAALPPSRPAVAAPPARPKPEVRAEAPAAVPPAAPAPRPASVQAPMPSTGASEYPVRPGDTLSRIAAKTQPAGISLDQMLVGLFRSNPDAFVDSNMNRLKAGSVLQVPASDALASVSTGEARQIIQAQSADFNAYRQRLAGVAPALKQEESERQAKGQVQAAVEDRKPAAAAMPDKLTLSKAASAAPEAKVSKDTEKKDAAARVAELTRNVEELKKLSSSASTAAPTPAPAPAVVAAASAAPAPLPAPTVLAEAPKPKPAAASAPSPARAPASAVPAAAPAAEPGIVDQLIENPLLPLGALLLAALAALGVNRLRKRSTSSGKADTGFHESRMQPDSFFGATGGQRVDTRDASTNGPSSMSYSLSQLDAIGDVDPVAEADVYLAYGRDLQAEEILKEALRGNPERLAIRLKLLEVYAKRRDTKGFEQLAIQLFAETHGQGEDWARAQELGRQIDAENPLYQPGGAPSQSSGGQGIHPEPMDASTMPATVAAGTAASAAFIAPHLATEPVGLSAVAVDTGPVSGYDMDLDLDLDSPPPATVSPNAMDATQVLATTVEQAPLAMDFDLSTPPAEIHTDEMPFDLDALDEPAAAAADAGNALDFDLSSIDLDLPEATAPAAMPLERTLTLDRELPGTDELAQALDALGNEDGDPLLRQLELADEFRQIGDTEGAREVLQELIAKAGGSVKDRAQRMLAELR
ncbi:FimV/HubP family polar landmark protein [Roseateles violae]|uniref:FimV/HubP family polar landmark protein n=1 Tax=Roseateles violae TaxID=3058042 RepID=A0ABT8DU96_9BURK|nr:FimV/HubP family polar landmark protein [Pelomonas sp. PFR6]MDN3921757.1 FimV/HubP family polar landmark protein [Pelomonas sp. PFR6]